MKDNRKKRTKYKVRSYTESEVDEFIKFDQEESVKISKTDSPGELVKILKK